MRRCPSTTSHAARHQPLRRHRHQARGTEVLYVAGRLLTRTEEAAKKKRRSGHNSRGAEALLSPTRLEPPFRSGSPSGCGAESHASATASPSFTRLRRRERAAAGEAQDSEQPLIGRECLGDRECSTAAPPRYPPAAPTSPPAGRSHAPDSIRRLILLKKVRPRHGVEPVEPDDSPNGLSLPPRVRAGSSRPHRTRHRVGRRAHRRDVQFSPRALRSNRPQVPARLRSKEVETGNRAEPGAYSISLTAGPFRYSTPCGIHSRSGRWRGGAGGASEGGSHGLLPAASDVGRCPSQRPCARRQSGFRPWPCRLRGA